ncbi:hypothetical protein AB0M92_37855 [Streptomyces sp. NPDC051582]|uniref:hypothetical protein n=1 Tax=Streptomyces sp. NPDC051582 TaxID=3155167 RepID=UPI003427FB77
MNTPHHVGVTDTRTRTAPLSMEIRPGGGRSHGTDKRACVCGWNCFTRSAVPGGPRRAAR